MKFKLFLFLIVSVVFSNSLLADTHTYPRNIVDGKYDLPNFNDEKTLSDRIMEVIPSYNFNLVFDADNLMVKFPSQDLKASEVLLLDNAVSENRNADHYIPPNYYKGFSATKSISIDIEDNEPNDHVEKFYFYINLSNDATITLNNFKEGQTLHLFVNHVTTGNVISMPNNAMLAPEGTTIDYSEDVLGAVDLLIFEVFDRDMDGTYKCFLRNFYKNIVFM